MNLRKRLAILFLSRLFIMVLMLGLVILVSILYAQDKVSKTVEPAPLLKEAAQKTSVSPNSINIAPEVLQKVAIGNGWLQILDGQGYEIYQFHKPVSIPSQYSPGQLVYYRQFPSSIGYKIYSWYKEQNGQSLTWLYGVKFSESENSFISQGNRFWIFVLFICILFVVLMALLFGIQLGAPVIHMLNWLKNISAGSYNEPLNKKGQPRSHITDSKRLRHSYKIYQEVIDSLKHVTEVLRKGEADRIQLDRTREEWITGVSHDLKTPLSSIKGYSKLLSATQYSFDEEEVRGFICIIEEKADYMEDLIEDLNLTFRLKNNALPLILEAQNVVELARRSVIDIVNSPYAEDRDFEFYNSDEEEIIYLVDRKWFKRAIDNLLMNAVKHNPAGTVISFKVETSESEGFKFPGVIILIQDNGIGMDKQTLEHLFDRYYRGTNTEDGKITGSGLGTAISKQLIEAHGGSLAVYSSPETGTKIYITLPPKN